MSRLTSCLHPGVSVAGSGDLVRQIFGISSGVGIVKSSADQSFGREKGVFWVCYGLFIVK